MATTSTIARFAARRWLSMIGVAALAACASTPRPVLDELPDGPPVEVSTAEGLVRGVTQGRHEHGERCSEVLLRYVLLALLDVVHSHLLVACKDVLRRHPTWKRA